jgi:hypothetical protein
MAQTLEELFKSKQLTSQGGKTAAEAYDIRNSKDIRISTSDPLINNTGFAPARLLRKTLGVRGSETLLEEEVTGLRIIRGFSTPVIYGNEITRITLRTTPILDLMKTATSGEVADGGLIGGKLTKLRDNVNAKLGIPQAATPTFVVNALNKGGTVENEPIKLGLTQDRMNDLAAIRKSAEGSLLGKLLKDGGGGNLKTIGKQALGSAIKLGKQLIRKKLFGDGERSGLKITGTPLSNGSVTGFTQESADFFQVYTKNYGFDKDATPATTPSDKRLDAKGASYSSTIKPDADTAKERNDLSYKQQLDYEPLTEWRNQGGDVAPIRFSQTPDRIGKFSNQAEVKGFTNDNNLETDNRGFYTLNDTINNEGVFSGLSKGELDDVDFIPLKFYSIHLGKTAQFRCTVTGLNETFSPTWDSYKFLGSPFNNYTYSGIERSVTFNFKVYSLNPNEHKVVWDKLNFLTGLVYPQGYYDTSALAPPFIKFTLGDLFRAKDGFIESLSYTYDDNTPWNILNSEKSYLANVASSALGALGNVAPAADVNMRGYKLPMIVDVAVTIKFLESRGNSAGRKFFNFNPQTS